VRQKHLRFVSLLAAIALATTACGARLNDQQVAAARAGATRNAGGTSGDGIGATQDTTPGDSGSADTVPGSTGNNNTGGGGSTATTSASGGGGGSTTNVHAMPAGGNGGSTDVGVSATSITLGNVSTLTGPVPGLFQGATVGAQAAVAYENSVGGLFGRKFKLDARDDQFDTGQNRSQTVDLIGKALGFLGSFSLYDDAAVNEIKAAGLPDVSHALGNGRLAMPNNFSIQPSASGGPLGPFNYFKGRYPDAIKFVGSIYADIPSAAALHQGYKRAAESVGYKFIYERGIGATETDFTSDVVRMRDAGVKLVYFTSVDDKTTARFAKAMKAQGFKPTAFVVNGSAYDPDVIALAGDAADGMFVPSAASMYAGEDASVVPEVALMDKWVQNVKPGFKPDIFTAYAWAGGRLLFQAMENVGPKVTRPAITEAIRKIGVFDDFGLFAPSNPGSKAPASCFIVLKITGGKFVRFDSPPAAYRCSDGPWFFG
jgi:ABC-type branched-subunit amino acid transport system substrate-binding protein